MLLAISMRQINKYKMEYYIEGKGEGTDTGCNRENVLLLQEVF